MNDIVVEVFEQLFQNSERIQSRNVMTAFTEKNAYNEVTKSTYGKLTVIDKGLYAYEHGQNHDK